MSRWLRQLHSSTESLQLFGSQCSQPRVISHTSPTASGGPVSIWERGVGIWERGVGFGDMGEGCGDNGDYYQLYNERGVWRYGRSVGIWERWGDMGEGCGDMGD